MISNEIICSDHHDFNILFGILVRVCLWVSELKVQCVVAEIVSLRPCASGRLCQTADFGLFSGLLL